MVEKENLTSAETMNEVEASDFLRLRVSTLRWWRWSRKGPVFYKVGRRVVYRRSDLEAFLVAGKVVTSGGAA